MKVCQQACPWCLAAHTVLRKHFCRGELLREMCKSIVDTIAKQWHREHFWKTRPTNTILPWRANSGHREKTY